MTTFSGLLSILPVVGYNYSSKKFVTSNFLPKLNSRSKMRSLNVIRVSKGGNYGLKFDDDEFNEEPYLVHLVKESMRGSKELFDFLVQQPGQLKYIEWPSFKDTLRTATLTLVLVALLIVALASIDAALSFMLALLLRRPA